MFWEDVKAAMRKIFDWVEDRVGKASTVDGLVVLIISMLVLVFGKLLALAGLAFGVYMLFRKEDGL